MSYATVGSTIPAVRFLDVAPMISALQFQPMDFELSRGWLRHVPSRHRFKFDACNRCALRLRESIRKR